MESKLKITGNVELYEFPPSFTYQDYLALKKHGEHTKYLRDKGSNLVVDAGLIRILELLADVSDVGFTHNSVGSGTNVPAAANTDLQTPIIRITVTDRYRSSLTQNWDTFWSTTQGNGTWNETGIHDAASAGTMLCRRKFASAFTKSASNTALVAWSIIVAAVAD